MPIGFAKIDIKVPELNPVLNQLSCKWHAHYNSHGYEGGWDLLTLRSPGGSTEHIFAELMGEDEYSDTAHMQNFPAIKTLLALLQCPIMAVRLLNLKAGAVIKQHRDCDLAYEKGETRLHFPVITNDQVEFYVNNCRVIMEPGECWYINANLPHSVANYGSSDRIHLVVDCQVNDWLAAVFDQSEKTEFEDWLNQEETFKIIGELRKQQTESANKMADILEFELNALKENNF